MDKKSNRNEEDMSMTFVGEINQKSAIAKEKKEQEKKNLRIEDLSQEEEQNPLEKDFSSNEGEEELFSSKPKQNKKSPIFIIFLFLLALGIGAFGSYYYFEVYQSPQESVSSKKDVQDEKMEQEELNPEGVFVKNLISRYDIYTIFEHELCEILYNEEKVVVNDWDQNVISILAAKDASNQSGGISTNRFSNEEFHNSVVKLFGTDKIVKDQDIQYHLGEATYIYDANTGYYHYKEPQGLGGTTTYTFERKNLKAETNGEVLKVTVAIALLDTNTKKVYKKYQAKASNGVVVTDEVEGITIDNFSIDKDYDKLDQYQYTFHYDKENNNYFLTEIELVK